MPPPATIRPGTWTGEIQGTNSGSILAELTVTRESITGIIDITDAVFGLAVYSVAGQVRPDGVYLTLTPSQQAKRSGHGTVMVRGQLVSPTSIVGQWQSSVGTNGTLAAARLNDDPKKIAEGPSAAVRSDISFVTQNDGGLQKRTTVFISYSHRDFEWLERLRVHLKPLERDYAIDIWDDRKIEAGSKWREAIEAAIYSTRVALLVVTADFLASDFIFNNELRPLLEAAANDGAIVLSLIVSPSRFRSTTLAQFQAVNDPSRPLLNMTKGEQEEVLVKVSEQIEIALKSTVLPSISPAPLQS